MIIQKENGSIVGDWSNFLGAILDPDPKRKKKERKTHIFVKLIASLLCLESKKWIKYILNCVL